MSNNRGNIKLAFETFLKDLQQCEDYKRFKENATQIVYDNDTHQSSTVYYRVPEVNTKKTRKLNKKLKI